MKPQSFIDQPIGTGPADIPIQTGAPEQWLASMSAGPDTFLGIINGYVSVFVVAFAVTLLVTPIMRRLAAANGIVDRPSHARKIHREPVAYLGGVAIFLGIMAGILLSYLALAVPGLIDFHESSHLVDGVHHELVRPSIVLGLFVIMLVGLLDDVVGIEPRIKIGGQLFAAAALAIDDVGVNVARGLMAPIGRALIGDGDLSWTLQLPIPIPLVGDSITFDLIYWTGTAIIAIFVLGACNASNLVDGLDGLLSGVTAIAGAGLLVIAVAMAMAGDGPRDAQRIVLAMALMGACLGFLPHNFNPANIFLGDCGSLLLGFCTIVIILTLGDRGATPLVVAGLIVYSIPLIDTTLAIIRRRMAGRPISDPDDQHLHHILTRSLGVKRAVLTLYAIGVGFAVLGVTASFGRPRVVYTLAFVFIAFIAVTAIKIGKRQQPALARAGRASPKAAQRVKPPHRPPHQPARDPEREPEPEPTGHI